MTVILGTVEGGTCYMLGDRGVWAGGRFVHNLGEPKVWRWGGGVIGGAGTLEALMFVREWCRAHPSPDGHPAATLAFARQDMAPFPEKYADRKQGDLDLLVGYAGEFSEVNEQGAWFVRGKGPCYVGDADIALGALLALETYESDPRKRLRRAAKFEAQHGGSCRAPFDVICED